MKNAFSNLIDAVIAVETWEDVDELEFDTEDASNRGYITDEEHDQIMSLCHKLRMMNDWFPDDFFEADEDEDEEIAE